MLISPDPQDSSFHPYIDVISNADLLRLLDYTEMYCAGEDERFEEFNGALSNIIEDLDDIQTLFLDLFFTITDTNDSNVIEVSNIDDYFAKQKKPTLRVV